MLRKLLFVVTAFAVAGHWQASAQPTAYWQQELHYRIDVSLNDSAHTLDGFLKLEYINHSPDTIRYIWFHLWPNAYKTDRTAFTEQQLRNGQTEFYFSGRDERGYINRLDFREDNEPLETEDDSLYIDMMKVLLREPLRPGGQVSINTPFHVKLPAIFSRSGHEGQFYQVTQWYPKPAVYDRNGWHPMPYLDQGEFYGDFGSYDVRITLPSNYVVAATGRNDDPNENEWLTKRSAAEVKRLYREKSPPKTAAKGFGKPKTIRYIPSSAENKTLRFTQDSVHDFAWFASKEFIVQRDTFSLASGKTVTAGIYYRPSDSEAWTRAPGYARDAIRFRSASLGDYPFGTVSVVAGAGKGSGGMEYPTITVLSGTQTDKLLDFTIEHELGHNWFYGMLATNERAYPWMDEGMNTYYDLRYLKEKYGSETLGVIGGDSSGLGRKLPGSEGSFLVTVAENGPRPQPFDLPADQYLSFNYNALVYFKTAEWMQRLEQELGRPEFDRCMQAYFNAWKFRHPYPSDFQKLMEKESGRDLDSLFRLQDNAGPLVPLPRDRRWKLIVGANFSHPDKYRYLGLVPLPGWNKYDGFMAGVLLHNYDLPSNPFRFAVVPIYAFHSQSFNYIGHLAYQRRTHGAFESWRLSLGLSRFSSMSSTSKEGKTIFGAFRKYSPALRLVFRERQPLSTRHRWLEWKTYIIGERGFGYALNPDDSMYYPALSGWQSRYLNQLTYKTQNYRALYPYSLQLQAQQGNGFYRVSATATSFLNYAGGGGAEVRFFAAKFGYLGGSSIQKQFDTYLYQPKLTAVRGSDDYTYSDYFMGRNELDGLLSQQIMDRDADLKIRTDLFQDPPVRSDDWVAAINLNTSLPYTIIPKAIPLKLFLDIGTYAPAWKKDAEISRFLYVGGLQLSLFQNVLNIYAPLLYSSEFRNNLKSVPEENRFGRKISFSINLGQLNLRRLTHNQVAYE